MSAGSDTQKVKTGMGKNAKQFANQIIDEGQRLVDKNVGFKAYNKQPYTDMAAGTQQAINQMTQLASQGNQFYQPAADFTQNLISGGLNHDTSGFNALMGQNPNAVGQHGTGIASGANGITVGNQLQGILGQGMPNAVDQYGRRIASGNKAIGTEGDYRSLLNSVDPEFENVLQTTLGDVRDQIQGEFGGASYGSAANTDYLTKGLSDVSSKMRSENFYNNLAAKQGILGDITGVQGANIGNQLSAAGMLSGEQQGGINSQANILGQIGGFQGQNINNQLAASGMLSGEQQQAFNNTRGILGDVANLNQTNIQNQAQGVGMAPGVYQQQYLPSQVLASVGTTQQQQADKQLAALMEQYNIKQQAPWNRTQAAAGLLTGAASGLPQTQTQTTETNPWGQVVGAGLTAAQLFAGMPPTAALSGTGGMY